MNSIPSICQNIGVSFPEKSLFCMSDIYNGNLVAFSGRRNGIYMLSLEDPWELDTHKIKFKTPPHSTSHEVTNLSWSGHTTQPIFSVSLHQQLYFWQQTQTGWSPLTTLLDAHKSAWTSSSCSADGEIKVWDSRTLSSRKREVRKLIHADPPHFLKWSQNDSVFLFSTHKGLTCAWDLRKPDFPVVKLFTSTSDVTSIDASPTRRNVILTTDNTAHFKLWDWEMRTCIGTGATGCPVDKAKFSPFGEGVAVSSKHSNIIQLFQTQKPSEPKRVGSFTGQDSTIQFGWRVREFDRENRFQLIALGALSTVRMVAMPAQYLEDCGHCLPGSSRLRKQSCSSASESAIKLQKQSIKYKISMTQEFDDIKALSIGGAFIQSACIKTRALVVHFRPSSETKPVIELKMTFPSAYPAAVPSFIIQLNTTGIPDDVIKAEVRKIGEEYVHTKGENCIEACLRSIVDNYIMGPMLSGIMREADQQQRQEKPPDHTPLSIQEKLKQLGPDYETYLVKPGDSMGLIGLTFNMELIELRRLNEIQHSCQLQAGALIVVKKPGATVTPAPVGPDTGTQTTDFFHKSNELVMRTKLHFLQDSGKPQVSGQAILTGKQFMFEPNLDDPVVQQQGVIKFTFAVDFSNIAQCFSMERPSKKRYPVATLMIGCKTRRPPNNRVLQFSGPEDKIHEICAAIQPLISTNHDSKLMESLGLDGWVNLPKVNSKVFRAALEPSLSPRGKKIEPLQIVLSTELRRSQNIKKGSVDDSPLLLKRETIKDLNLSPNLSEKRRSFLKPDKPENKLSESKSGIKRESRLENKPANKLSNKPESKPANKPENKPKSKLETKPEDKPQQTLLDVHCDSDDDNGPRLLQKSHVLSNEDFHQLQTFLPHRFWDHNWKREFSTEVDGSSLQTFYLKLEGHGPCVLIIQDTEGYVFGGFISGDWKERDPTKFFGNGESFVFSLQPTFAHYKWTNANEHFVKGTNSCIAMGGVSGRFAFYIDSSFHFGTSAISNTFLNRQLSNTEEFDILAVEAWVFENR